MWLAQVYGAGIVSELLRAYAQSYDLCRENHVLAATEKIAKLGAARAARGSLGLAETLSKTFKKK